MKYYLSLIIVFSIKIIFSQPVYSPDKNLELDFKLSSNGEFVYWLKYRNNPVIKESKLGFIIDDNNDLSSNFKIDTIRLKSKNEKWATVWGEVDSIVNNYNEVQISLIQISSTKKLIITFRIFNDGFGFRYEFPIQDKLKYFIIKDELTEFALTGNHKAFWIPGDYDSQEYTYTISRLSEINTIKGLNFDDIIVKSIPGYNFVQTPLMMKTNEGLYINIHEAALLDYPAMYLQIDKNNTVLKTHLCPDVLGNKAYLQTPFNTPWRTIIVSDKAENILSSKLIHNLKEPSKIEIVSWIKPSKICWHMVGNACW